MPGPDGTDILSHVSLCKCQDYIQFSVSPDVLF